MKCPKCKKEIDKVYVISDFTQIGELEGNKIVEYTDHYNAGPVGSTNAILCSECQEDIQEYIKE